jgi:agmatine deiminase
MERITSKNFITDSKTDKVYISSLINRKSGALMMGEELKSRIMKFCPNCELLYNTMDVWARDYMPIQLTNDVYLGYTYKPDYLIDYPNCVTNWQLHNVHTQKQLANDESFDFKVVQMPIILDGGNVVKAIVNDKPCIIMCDKVLEENNSNSEDFYNWWDNWWKDNFDGTEMELVLLPWEGPDDNPIGHADGMVRYIDEGRVLLTNYPDFNEIYKDGNGVTFKDKLEEVGFEVETLSYIHKFKYKEDKMFSMLFYHSWCYINYLQVGNKILVPSLGYPDLDQEALRQINDAFNAKKHVADIQLIDIDMTSVVEDMGSEQNSGGALNCLTWTTKA